MTTSLDESPNTTAEFVKFPKIARYVNETFTITEKIDGTNACLVFDEMGRLTCQSRNRIITPDNDNAAFAAWAYANAEQLFEEFGPGRHFGEWWGAGIQRRYNQTTKRFSPFNVTKWPQGRRVMVGAVPVEGVPALMWDQPIAALSDGVTLVSDYLRTNGSKAAPGFMNAEGLMVFFHQMGKYLKVPFEAAPKGNNRQVGE